ncbi:serine hydrolase [Aquimarina sp. 2201CG1-2-11]|uniref:serine hydrolase n=1 Tax=Aquimarina discodermiae TaxID=3231043 RepID=UPI0034626B96
MNQTIIKRLLLLVLLTITGMLQAQIEKGEILKDKLNSSTIHSTEKHRYYINLEKDQFAFFRLLQKGVDLKITTYNVLNEKIEVFDSPNGQNGYELFAITSSNKGKYIIEIYPYDQKEPSGNYDLILEKIKPKATLPNEQVDEIFTPWDTNDTPGASVAIVKDGVVVHKNGYGLANLEYDIPITPSSVFHIASISKQFTVFSILLLEKQGKLNLDDDIRKYIPEVPDFGKKITLRHLASHTSGLRDQWNLLGMAGWRIDDVITKKHILKIISQQKELNFDPGEEYVYCNTGFTLLAEVVSRITDMSFAKFTDVNIFKPLKMENTLFYDDHEKIVKNRAYSYHTDSLGYKKSVLNYANVGATSLFTTAEDLGLWAMNFSNIKVGDASIIDKMNTPATLNNGKTFGGALGQFVTEYKGIKEIQHGGADAGYRSYLARFPEENFSVMILSNSASFNPNRIAHKIADIYLKDKLKTNIKKEIPKKENTSSIVDIDQSILDTYIGNFELKPGFNINISKKDGQLTGQATGQSAFSLMPLSTTEFKIVGVEAKIEFIPNEGDTIKLLKLYQGGQILDANRLKEFDKTVVNLNDFSGTYFSQELSTTYTFIVEDTNLVVKHRKLNDFKLNPTGKDKFGGSSWMFRQVEFIRDANQKITGCKVSNGRVRNLYFKKIK